MISTDSPPIAKDRNGIPKRGGSRWRTGNQNRIYSAKLYEALRRIRRADSSAKPRCRSIREAAYRALAVTAGGRTRWSSAILAGRSIRLKNRRIRPVNCGERRWKMAGEGRGRGKMPAVEKKVKFLGRLVPGCRKLSLPLLLDEASDYIAALEMQVYAMKSLAEKLSALAGVPVVSISESPDSGSPVSS